MRVASPPFRIESCKTAKMAETGDDVEERLRAHPVAVDSAISIANDELNNSFFIPFALGWLTPQRSAAA